MDAAAHVDDKWEKVVHPLIEEVADGIARRFGWDLTRTRVLTVVAAFFAGSAVLIYIVLWIVVPEE